MKSEKVVVTTQEAVDGHCEKAMRIASVEQIELGIIMELSITGQVLRWARRSNLLGGVSLRRADGWNLKNHSHLTVARHLREKIHPSTLVVTIRESEERGMCSAALREFLTIVKDQIEERGVVIIVMNRESAIWTKASLKSVIRENQLKYADVEETRVITNNRCVAEQIKHDKVENAVMDGIKTGKVGISENCKIDEDMWSHSEERLCKSIIKGLARRNREKHAMLADVEEEQEQDVICFDDITGKELPWHAVRKARELELKYLRDLGLECMRKLMRKRNHSSGHKRFDTDKAFEGGPCRSDHECVRESSKVMIGQTCMQGLLHWRR